MSNDALLNRNHGIDLLRNISMIMITVLHVLGHGGVLESVVPLSIKYGVVWFVELLAYCAVNVYAIISGYVGYGKNQRFSRLIQLHMQVLFYTLVTTLAFIALDREAVSMRIVVSAFFPVAFNVYWYYSAYFCLFFFMPFINLAVEKFPKDILKRLLLFLLLIFSLLPTVLSSDYGMTAGGRSALWLFIMYTLGAYIRKYDVEETDRVQNKLLGGYLGCVIVTWSSKLILEYVTTIMFGKPFLGNYLLGYTSPTIVFAAIFLVLFFSRAKVDRKLIRISSFFSPLTFGVYLLQEEPLVRQNFIYNRFGWIGESSTILIPFIVVGIAMTIWLVSSFVEKGRILIFKKMKVPFLCAWLEKRLNKLLENLSILKY